MNRYKIIVRVTYKVRDAQGRYGSAPYTLLMRAFGASAEQDYRWEINKEIEKHRPESAEGASYRIHSITDDAERVNQE